MAIMLLLYKLTIVGGLTQTLTASRYPAHKPPAVSDWLNPHHLGKCQQNYPKMLPVELIARKSLGRFKVGYFEMVQFDQL